MNTSVIRHEQVRLLYQSIPFAVVATLINAVFLVAVLWSVSTPKVLLGWLATIGVVNLLRYLLTYFYQRQPIASDKLMFWERAFVLGSSLSALMLAILVIGILPQDDIVYQIFVAFVLAGICAGAVTSLSFLQTPILLYLSIILIPLMVQLALGEHPVQKAIALLIILFFFVLASSSKRIYLNTLQNITLRLQTVEGQAQLQQFKDTLDQTLDCVFMFSADTLRFFYFNQGALDQVGYTSDELLHMHPFDIKPDYDETHFRELIQPLTSGETHAVTFETLHQHKDGHTIPVEIFLQYITPASAPPHFVAIVRDISERKRLERLKDEFVSTVSHELRTPLTSLRGALGLITGGAVGELPEQQRSLLEIADKNSARLLLLINDILDIQKIESGNISFHYKTLPILELVNRAITENAHYAQQYSVNFCLTEQLEAAQVYADPDRIMQVLNNLLSNAAKFSPAGSDIEVAIRRHQAMLRISVTDHGPGIPEDFHSKVFDRFTQSDATDQRRHGGTGLGLAISRAIIEKHRGHINFISNEGQGTTFYFDLPEHHV